MTKWFGPKELGSGIRTWQGWVSTILFVALIFGIGSTNPAEVGVPWWTKPVLLAAVLIGFLALVFAKYERD